MDTNTLIGIVIVAVVIVVIALLFRARIKVGIKALGVALNVEAEGEKQAAAQVSPAKEPPAGVRIADAKSRAGGILASSDSGVDIQRVEVQGDIVAESKQAGESPKKI